MTALAGRTAVVTGGAKGIGAEFTAALAAAGASVVIADLADGAALAEKVSGSSGGALYVKTDVSSEESVTALSRAALERFGKVDILVNNAAIFSTLTRKTFLEISGDEWDRVIGVNVRGPFLCAKAFAPAMTKAGKGKIINIASGTVFKGMAGMLHYVSSKGAVVAMTRCLARELGPSRICVNAIAPGLTMSEGVVANPIWEGSASESTIATRALRRAQLPQDLTGTLVFLASDASDFITGQTIVVDGGAVMR